MLQVEGKILAHLGRITGKAAKDENTKGKCYHRRETDGAEGIDKDQNDGLEDVESICDLTRIGRTKVKIGKKENGSRK